MGPLGTEMSWSKLKCGPGDGIRVTMGMDRLSSRDVGVRERKGHGRGLRRHCHGIKGQWKAVFKMAEIRRGWNQESPVGLSLGRAQGRDGLFEKSGGQGGLEQW